MLSTARYALFTLGCLVAFEPARKQVEDLNVLYQIEDIAQQTNDSKFKDYAKRLATKMKGK